MLLNREERLKRKAEIKARAKAYYASKRKEVGFVEKEKARVTAWIKANKEKNAVIQAKRRALKINADSTMTKAEKENYANLVIIRDEATKLFGYAWSIEHIIPLSKGGTNAVDNLEVTPLSWNIAKNNRSSESFWC